MSYEELQERYSNAKEKFERENAVESLFLHTKIFADANRKFRK
jgi:hypothetical protein